MSAASVLWRRLDLPGHESARLAQGDGGWTLSGAAVFTHDGRLCRLYYEVRCDGAWHTTAARVAGFVGDEAIEVTIGVDAEAMGMVISHSGWSA